MDWSNYNNTINAHSSSLTRPPFSSSRPHHHDSTSLSFFYNYNNHYDPYQVVEMKHAMGAMERSDVNTMNGYDQIQEKKKRLTSDQLESLENSFQEEIKLDPDRKMRLAKDLGLQPRQIAVWFQNRRARWKAKQLERLYDAVKQELDVVSRENQKLQEEVLALRAIVKERGGYKKPASTGYTEISGTEETVESSTNRVGGGGGNNQLAAAAECSYVFNVNDYDQAAMATYWAGHLPSYP